jgi:hypothetical protein
MQVFESIKDLSQHNYSSKLHFGHRWLTHFRCANGVSRLCHAFFKWNFILGRGTYQWFSSPRRCLGCFGHFILMCNSTTFLSHMDNVTFFFLHVSFSEFQQENYAGMWGHYESKIVGVFSRPFNETSGSTTNILWRYRPFLYGRLRPHFFLRELGFGGSIFML